MRSLRICAVDGEERCGLGEGVDDSFLILISAPNIQAISAPPPAARRRLHFLMKFSDYDLTLCAPARAPARPPRAVPLAHVKVQLAGFM
ncbi:hypothetical protein EVAR_4779_1 [Eumeta japonica]|uniref:Uncharacterized protein n=1 Tax=Eumeta variegata TaxID=151549 RepID=A0A4C1T1S3_EUMVA|nr:hypothetical protein EVAR_4779_1 [Eumeta japonica]